MKPFDRKGNSLASLYYIMNSPEHVTPVGEI